MPAPWLLLFAVGLSLPVVGLLRSRRAGPPNRGLSEPQLALLFMLPAVLGVFLFYYYQIGQTVLYSLHDLRNSTAWSRETFVGLDNYVDAFRSPNFLSALAFTLYFTVVAVFLEFWIGLGLALATYRVGRGASLWLRSLIVIPWAIPPIISAAIWKWLLNADVGAGYFLAEWGLVESPPLFLAQPWLAMHAVILADVWKMSSMMAILMIGGLAVIPQDIYDAAQVDGARAFFRFRRITLPLLSPTILVALLFRSMDALRTFDLVYGLTNGGPGVTTETLSLLAYKFYFSRARFGEGSAYGIIIFGLVLLLSLLYLRLMRRQLRFGQL